jgi:signal transduction histidine kinase
VAGGIEASSILLTATLIYVSFSIRKARSLLVLAAGYQFAGLALVAWGLSFPGSFGPWGLLGGGVQTSLYLGIVADLSPGLAALAYVAASVGGDPSLDIRHPRGVIAAAVGLVVLLAAATTWGVVAAGDSLPHFMIDAVTVGPLWREVGAPVFVGVYAAAVLVVGFRSRSILDTWFLLALWSWLLESVLLLRYGARFSLRWYVGMFFEFFSASVVLAALLSQLTTLYARLASAAAAHRRERENRLLAVDAALGSVAHQTYQPISAIMTNSSAGLLQLARPEPDLVEIRAALNDILADGRRAIEAIDAIRGIFRTDGSGRAPLDVADLLVDVLLLMQNELRSRQIVVESNVEGRLPLVSANKTQLQQVLVNLVANAAEAMDQVATRARRLRIGAVREGNDVRVTLQDTGPGIDPALGESVFDPFVTTKSKGTGLGLPICRSIVEAHGGRLLLIAARPHGAVAQFTLPIAGAA